jgi:hypothetical protein
LPAARQRALWRILEHTEFDMSAAILGENYNRLIVSLPNFRFIEGMLTDRNTRIIQGMELITNDSDPVNESFILVPVRENTFPVLGDDVTCEAALSYLRIEYGKYVDIQMLNGEYGQSRRYCLYGDRANNALREMTQNYYDTREHLLYDLYKAYLIAYRE